MSPTLDEIARELYATTPADFVAARDEHVRQARERGDSDLARALGKLRRPKQSAWLVNLLGKERRTELKRLLDLGPAFRKEKLTADRLRELSAQRQKLVRGLLQAAHDLALQAGLRVSAEAATEVEATLGAAVADPELAEQVRRGQLEKPLFYTGFGPSLSFTGPEVAGFPTPGPAPTTPAPRPSAGQAPPKEAAHARDAEAERQLAQANAKVAEAERDLESRTTAWQKALRQRDDLRTQLERLRERVRDLTDQLAATERGVRAEERRRKQAEHALDAAQRSHQAVERRTRS
ncbi:hypothetical protein [Actinopolymorpha alba]|uniref:hypothetical protein n=1 Tax=Actinopolymorpha alba TaxID=533267 RepID=UPI0003633593|nr:hypothetical protein [Actinopolymorpha alba]